MASIGLDFNRNWLMASQTLQAPSGFSLRPKTPGPTFIYIISKGMMLYGDSGKPFALGCWSGHGAAMNDPTMTALKGVGPLPVGQYEYGFARDGGHLGPLVMPLHQVVGESYGRGDFYIHGSSAEHPALSSDGCVIMSRQGRYDMDAFACKIRLLEVRA